MTDYCFCLEPSTSSNLFKLDCKHSFHEVCMRNLLCHHWLGSTKPWTVDERLRKVVDIPCPLCRVPVSPLKLRQLQTDRKVITVHIMQQEDPLLTYFYFVSISNDLNQVVQKTYLSKYLPVFESVSQNGIHKLLYEDYTVVADSPLSVFHVKIRRRQRHPESSPVEVLKEFVAVAKDLPSISPNAVEEDCLRIMEESLSRNDLRTISCEEQDQMFASRKMNVPVIPSRVTDNTPPPLPSQQELWNDDGARREADSPPLPSLQELWGDCWRDPPRLPAMQWSNGSSSRDAAPVNSDPTAGPSRISEDRPRPVSWRQKRLLEEKAARDRKVLKKREKSYETKINASISASIRQLNALSKNIEKWRSIRNDLYLKNMDTVTETRENVTTRNSEVSRQIYKVMQELCTFSQLFP